MQLLLRRRSGDMLMQIVGLLGDVTRNDLRVT